ncbi:CehA/McbA family metallohydrolase [Roseovarius pacificus]|uniref:CehA/McbA family metallohydrolase n=1 Tax=Roseovarius pacificus TaxID=337701 RepID=UPI00374849FC
MQTVDGRPLPCLLAFQPLGPGTSIYREAGQPGQTLTVPSGDYRVYVYIYEDGLPIMAFIDDITVSANPAPAAQVQFRLMEGTGATRPLRDFDSDADLAVDRVEHEAGTNPESALSVPGSGMLSFDTPVLGKEERWYTGELHAQSAYGEGTESVAELIRRAENSGLDFLAIADVNTLASVNDPAYQSKRIVLIPAVKWGSDANGYALMYGLRTVPPPPLNASMAQGMVLRTQAQGGVFFAAHPCLPTAPWKWNLAFINGVEVWYRDWREMPPLTLDNLDDKLKTRTDRGDLIFSLAAAAATTSHSGNAQAAEFYEYETARGVKAALIAGSGTGSPKVPMGQPVTHVFAREKSLAGILQGLKYGRTYVTKTAAGPTVNFNADVLDDGKIDVSIGGTVPLRTLVIYEVGVTGAEGKKLQILQNGRAILVKRIESNAFGFRFPHFAEAPCTYQVRIMGPAEQPQNGFGPIDVYALTSPIYADDINAELFGGSGLGVQAGVSLEELKLNPSAYLDKRYWYDLSTTGADEQKRREILTRFNEMQENPENFIVVTPQIPEPR